MKFVSFDGWAQIILARTLMMAFYELMIPFKFCRERGISIEPSCVLTPLATFSIHLIDQASPVFVLKSIWWSAPDILAGKRGPGSTV